MVQALLVQKNLQKWALSDISGSMVEMKLSFFSLRDAFFDVKLNNRLFGNKTEKHFLGIERQHIIAQSLKLILYDDQIIV